MDVQIINCNNVLSGTLTIEPGKLNIIYAINGTGKTTIAKAIEYSANGDNSALLSLQPYQYMTDQIDEHQPRVSGLPIGTRVAVFNEDYISQYVFLPDELIKDTFEVFVRTPDYDKRMEEINQLIAIVRTMFENNPELEQLLTAMNDFLDSYGKAANLAKNSSLSKGLSKGNYIEHIPEGLEDYSAFLRSSKPNEWIKWQAQGRQFMELADTCPFCTSDLEQHKATINKVAETYDAKTVEHLSKILEIFERLGTFFSQETLDKVNELTSSVEGLTTAQKNYLSEIRGQVETLRSQLLEIRGINFNSLKTVDRLAEMLPRLMIDLSLYSHLNSEMTKAKVNIVNDAIAQLQSVVGNLQGAVNRQKAAIQKTIQQHQQQINSFLTKAGYSYSVSIEETEKHEYKLRLKYGQDRTIDKVKDHLSFGERNAFALVLFMFSAIHDQADLIILDDPISSYDRNKKFAIIDMLFVGGDSFRDKTVLLLTHDFEPIIDMVYTIPHHFGGAPKALFIENTDGILTEKAITCDDIMSSLLICKTNIDQSPSVITKIIYARRYYELSAGKGFEYDVLSSLIHRRDRASRSDATPLSDSEVHTAITSIREVIPGFDYDQVYRIVKEPNNLVNLYWQSSRYEKLQLYRMIVGTEQGEHVLNKFINETFHIENDYLFQLNPIRFSTIPQYIIQECDDAIKRRYPLTEEVQ